jgi:uncharacterized protein YukE
MTLRIDQAVVRKTSGELLHHHNVLGTATSRVKAVDTGETTALTADAVEDVVRRAEDTAHELLDLAQALEHAAQEARDADGAVSLVFTALGEAVSS